MKLQRSSFCFFCFFRCPFRHIPFPTSYSRAYYYPFLCLSPFLASSPPPLLPPPEEVISSSSSSFFSMHFVFGIFVFFRSQDTLLFSLSYIFCFYATLFYCPYAHLFSPAHFSTLIIFSSPFCFYIRQFHSFFFSRHGQSFLCCIVFSHPGFFLLPAAVSLPPILPLFISFSPPRTKHLYLPRVSV